MKKMNYNFFTKSTCNVATNVKTVSKYRAMILDIIKIQREKHFWLIKDFQGNFSVSLFNFPFDCV